MKTFLFILFAAAPLCAQETAVTVKTVIRDDGTQVTTKTDFENKTAEASTYQGASKLLQRVVYSLDEQNRANEGMVYDGKGRFLYKMVLTLNAAGKVTEEQRFSQNGKLQGRLIYHYDAQGRFHKADAYDAEGNLVTSSSSTAKKDVKKSTPKRR